MIGTTTRKIFRLLWLAVVAFVEDGALTQAAALAFSTLLSLAPTLVLALWATQVLGWNVQGAMIEQIGALASEQATRATQSLLDSARQHPVAGNITGAIGLCIAVVGATSVLVQLQAALNHIWRFDMRDPRNAVWQWIRQRLLCVGLLVAVAFVLVASLLIGIGLDVLLPHAYPIGKLLNQGLSLIVLAFLFAGLFRYLPQSRIHWRHALGGGAVTALLYLVGKSLIGLYLTHGALGSAYGAASALVVLLMWVYYSSAIFLFGAELIKAWLVVYRAVRT